MPLAYSYARFSSAAQEGGHSLQRQIDAAKAFVERHPEHELVLDNTLNLVDAGISAFRGDNTQPDAALGRFIVAVGQGLVAQGSWLLIESWDRFSRQRVNKVAGLLLSLINQGIVIATIHNGNIYRESDFDEGPNGLVQLLGALIAMQGHYQEQVEKGKRVKAAWGSKYEKVAAGVKLTKITPFWLRLNDDRKSFTVIPEHVKTVERIFSLRQEGHGAFYIASKLNAENVPPIRGKKWGLTTIKRLLGSPSVIGTFTNAHGESFEGYFPPVISKDQYGLIQALSGAPNSQGGKANASHELVRLIKHQCGTTMRRMNKGSGYVRLRCLSCNVSLTMESAKDAVRVAVSNLTFCGVSTDWGVEISELQNKIEFELVPAAEDAFHLHKATRTRRTHEAYLQADKALNEAREELTLLLQNNRALLLRMEENSIRTSPDLLIAARKIIKSAIYDSDRQSLTIESLSGRVYTLDMRKPGSELMIGKT